MRILLTNDDGIDSPGILAVLRELEKMGEVYVVAPDRERSGTGHSITVFSPIKAQRVEVPGSSALAWVIDGTPADCVKLGISALIPKTPDYVVSGVNRGANLGTDVLYSGTVSAALEGVIMGFPSVAVSLDSFNPNEDFSFAARFTRLVLRILHREGVGKDIILNINVPCLPRSEIRGIRITKLGVRRYENLFEERKDPRGNSYYWLGGEVIREEQDPDSDVAAVNQGYISITPIHFDLTDYQLIEDFRRRFQPYIDIS
ncbi:MAG: 5'/3'-nucleotidase SurE [Syntrophothermus sp.]|uniref:5'/3'-nucleotidase SurE n=1 Tax=Syntrophothermus sp. TaxID=2736299 RepID=UPI00257FCBB9|nr:5'/3'-nucleotidase SurE [Syntrophothermus sp.]NSW83857.1 5'/3'-nucleotidase SurE [Syntrophothermus sp.]